MKELKYLTLGEVKQRCEKGDLLIVMAGKVHDVTSWAHRHPGGTQILALLNGKDATDAALAFHPADVIQRIMPRFVVAHIHEKDTPKPPLSARKTLSAKISADYHLLHNQLISEGLFKTDIPFYMRELAKLVTLFVLAIYFGIQGNGVVAGLFTAALWQQAAFCSHDAAHSGISHTNYDHAIGIVLTAVFGGLSLGWWKRSHNVHHIVTNDPEHDPDIQHLPVFAISKRFAELGEGKGLWSSYHRREMVFSKLAKLMVPMQDRIFYVIMAFGRFNLYVESWKHVFETHHPVPFRLVEISGMSLFWVWYSVWQLPSPFHQLSFVIISNCLTFILHTQITLSHFGMSTEDVEDESYAEKAFRTTMDIECPVWMDWFHGGLQFQVEHHLFPRMPRSNLRRAQPFCIAFAKKHGLAFYKCGFVNGNRKMLGVLRDVATQISVLMKGECAIGKRVE